MDDGLSNILLEPFRPYTQYRDSDTGIAMIGKILIAVDGSENNNKAVDEAIGLAKGLGASITAVYVTNHADVRPNAFGGDAGAQERAALVEKESKEAFHYINKAAAAAGIEVNCLLLAGQPGTEIVKLTPDYDLIVCGSLGRTGLSKVLMGSVSSAIVKYSECPVLVSRRDGRKRGPTPALPATRRSWMGWASRKPGPRVRSRPRGRSPSISSVTERLACPRRGCCMPRSNRGRHPDRNAGIGAGGPTGPSAHPLRIQNTAGTCKPDPPSPAGYQPLPLCIPGRR